ncbi:MAG: hypothetical protein A3E83_00095 [Gammaproteobacteria bacterium RIFCSPHIGHO2_12_FULL_41_20]|nr:MAG: hypothetical protein A3E83_00095 [Gammaproteobacteria bacterium RIFCSPHIGHO2_12_FULL_41_20]
MKIVSLVALGAMIPALSYSAPQQQSVSPAEKARIEQVVHDYLLSNPQVIMEAVQVLQKKQMDEMQQTVQKTQGVAAKYAESLFHQNNDPVAGNPQGKVTLVEFLDYQCGHCIEMSGMVDEAIKKNPDLRVVFKQFPIRGPVSVVAAKAALAANQQGKYFEFHNAMIQTVKKGQPLTENDVYQVAQTIGLNVDKLKTEMNDKVVDQSLKNNYKLAQELKLFGTPAFFIGKTSLAKNAATGSITYIPGGMSESQLQELISKNQG